MNNCFVNFLSSTYRPITWRCCAVAGSILCLIGTSLRAQNGVSGAGPAPHLVVPADTFSIGVFGFNTTLGGAIVLANPVIATFGLTQIFPNSALSGQTVTVTSSEVVGATMTTATFIISVPTNFVPAGATAGLNPVNLVEVDIGGLNAGSDRVNFLLPITSPVYSGSVLYGTNSTLALNPHGTLGDGGMTLFVAESVSMGGADLSPLNIRSFTFVVTYANPVPEPATWAMMLVGVAALIGMHRVRHNGKV